MPEPDISIITPTYRRPKDLWRLLECSHLQQLNDLLIEHLIIPDGPGEQLSEKVHQAFPQHSQITRLFLPQTKQLGQYGAGCKDIGLKFATGKSIVFWDDDNWFYSDALIQLHQLLCEEKSIGVSQLRHNAANYLPVPRVSRWEKAGKQFRSGNIDTGCFIINAKIAKQATWLDHQGSGSDYRYFERVVKKAGGYRSVIFDQNVIGVHL